MARNVKLEDVIVFLTMSDDLNIPPSGLMEEMVQHTDERARSKA